MDKGGGEDAVEFINSDKIDASSTVYRAQNFLNWKRSSMLE